MKKMFTMVLVCVAALAMQTVSAGTGGNISYPGKTVYAKENNVHIHTIARNASRVLTCDTISNLNSLDSGNVFGWSPPAVGFVSGNGALANQAGTSFFPIGGVGEEFQAPLANQYVTSAFVFFGVAVIKPADSAKLITAYVYDSLGAGLFGGIGPGAALDSATVTFKSIAQAAAVGGASVFNFTHAAAIPGTGFFITVKLPLTTGDTLAVVTNDGWTGNGRGWIDIAGNGWLSYDSMGTGPLGDFIVATLCSNVTATCPTIATTATQASATSATASASGGASPYSYRWNTVPAQTSATATNLTPGQTYHVTATDNNGCTGTATVTIAATGSCPTAVTITETTPGTLTATVTGGAGPFTYAWSFNDGFGFSYLASTQNVTNVEGGLHATLTVSSTGCPNVTATFTSTNTANCPTTVNVSTTQLANGDVVGSAVGGTTPYFYHWDFGTYAYTSYNDTLSAPPVSAGAHGALTVITPNGCPYITNFTYAAPAGTCPTITVTTTQLSTTSALASATGGVSPYTFQWSNAGFGSGDTAKNLSVGSTYTVTAADHNGCTATASITISAGSCPTITATATQINTTPTAYATATGGVAPYTYRWSTTPVQTTDTATGLVVGTYTVTVADHNGCTATATVTTVPNGIEAISGVTKFTLYPNPSNGVFTTSISLQSASDVTISVLDMTGNKVYETTDKAVKEITKPINLGAIAGGVYIVNVKTNNGSANQRIIVK